MVEVIENQHPGVVDNGKEHRSRSGFWIGIIVLLVIVILTGAGFFLLQQLRDKQEDLGGKIQQDDSRLSELIRQMGSYQTQVAALQSQLATLEAEVLGKDNHFNKKLDDYSKLHQETLEVAKQKLTTAIQQVQRQLGKTRGDWLIADAEYLLSVANQRLHLMGDINTTREALHAADQRLRESGDAAAFKVREQLARELDALRDVLVPDIVGIYSSLEALGGNVAELSVLLPYAGKEMTKTEHNHEAKDDDHVHDLLDSALIELEGLVTIRHTDQPVKSILTPEEAQFIRQQMKVKLEIVKIALVQRNEQLYQAGIADAKHWLAQNFASNADADTFAKELDRLNAINIQSQFPDISLSLKMLRDITKLRIETDKALSVDDSSSSVGKEISPEKQVKNDEDIPEHQQQAQ